jgi:transposase
METNRAAATASPAAAQRGRPPLDDRKALTGIIFVLKTGIQWEYLPKEMGCGCGIAMWRPSVWSFGFGSAGSSGGPPKVPRTSGHDRPHFLTIFAVAAVACHGRNCRGAASTRATHRAAYNSRRTILHTLCTRLGDIRRIHSPCLSPSARERLPFDGDRLLRRCYQQGQM